MDSIINAAVEEVCIRGSTGIAISDLWRSLATALSSSGLPCSDSIRGAIWTRLLSLPVLRFSVNGCVIASEDPKVQSLDEAQRLGLKIVGDEQLRDSYVGLDDLNAAHGEISVKQRRTLERIAAARDNGVTQCELCKEFRIKGNVFHYQVRNLESQQLIVKKSSTVWEKEAGSDVENGLKSNPNPFTTNLIHLYRYRKSVNLKPQQKYEIRRSAVPDMPEGIENADKESGDADIPQGECLKEDVLVKDYLPAMEAVCEKLEQANGKVLVVKDIKVALNYRKTSGHRAWRNIMKRLEDAGIVEIFKAEVTGRSGKCLRLLKRFDRHHFQSKEIASTYDGFDADDLPKPGRRGNVTDQFLELPMEHRIYDLVDEEGPKGITIPEVCERLGLSSKKVYKRFAAMCARFGMCMESEKPDRTQFYRLWTPRSYKEYSDNISSGDCEHVLVRKEDSIRSSDAIPHEQSVSEVQLLESSFQDQDLHLEKQSTYSAQDDLEQSSSYDKLASDTQLPEHCMVPQSLTNEASVFDNDSKVGTGMSAPDTSIVVLESHPSVPLKTHLSVSTTAPKQSQWFRSVEITARGTRRKKWILKRLELKDLEKDSPTVMDKKTLQGTLNNLQKHGLCRIIRVSIPTLKNFNRERKLGVVLHPSIDVTSDLNNQIYKRLREFENQSRSPEAGKSMDYSVTPRRGVKRSSDHADDKPEILGEMCKNGFVLPKMIRARLLHNFLWDYICSLPDLRNNSPSIKDDCSLKNHLRTCAFTIDAATKAMPLELFLQIVGSEKVIDNRVQKCRAGLRLMDLPVQEYKLLLDPKATERLYRIVDILQRLKLVQFVWQRPSDMDIQPHANSMVAMELEPYIEEPLPRVPTSLKIDALDPRPRIRHDFVFSKKEDVNEYWGTLEYCYASADLASASLSFPGSVVHEVLRYRSWTSLRVMTADQRMELVRHIEIDNLEKKIPFPECVKIARELNLAVEQVVSVAYDKNRKRMQRSLNSLKSKEQGKCVAANAEPPVKKRRISNDRSDEHVPDGKIRETSLRPTMHSTPCADGNNMNRDFSLVINGKIHDDAMKTCGDNSDEDHAVKPESDVEDDQSLAFIKRMPHRIRRRITWTDELDRQIIMQYARHRVIMGERLNRVAWSLIRGLPACPDACRRRMNRLNNDKSTRTAVMRLCNILAGRYSNYLNSQWGTRGKNTFNLGDSTKSSHSSVAGGTVDRNILCVLDDRTFPQECWDDFENVDCKMAIDEVLRCKRMARLEPIRGNRSLCRQSSTDGPPNKGVKLDPQKDVTSIQDSSVSSSCGNKNDGYIETGNRNNDCLPTTTQNRSSSRPPHGKVTKLLSSGGIEIWRQVHRSTTLANVVELLKLSFLSNSNAPEVQTSLEETLRLYDQREIIAAFNYLQEKGFVNIGNENRPALSHKFWCNACSSPFPKDSGKRAANFSSWLQEQDKNLDDGIDLLSDIQCGEIFHLFALIYSGEVFISPILPKEGIGEASEFKGSESLLLINGEVNDLKRRGDEVGLPYNDRKNKKQKFQWKADSEFCSRCEKGFPGIKVCINRATIAGHGFQCLADGKNNTRIMTNKEEDSPDFLDIETTTFTPSLNSLRFSDDFGDKNQWEEALGESLYGQITKYAEQLALALVVREASAFCPDLFRSIRSVLDQAGEQGLNIEEISNAIGIQEVQLAKVAVDTLEAFQLAFKVNAYECVRIVASSHRSKYFIGMHANSNRKNSMPLYTTRNGGMMSYKSVPQMSQDWHDDVVNSENDATVSLSDGHKITFLDLPLEPGIALETQMDGENITSGRCNRVDVVSVKRNELGNKLFSAPSAPNACRSILPWINADGSMNTIVYKGLTRRVIGTVMQSPGILEEDIIHQMDVLNPQSCRQLLETMVLDNHLITRLMHQTASAACPSILHNLFTREVKESKPEFRIHYFANPMSASLL